MFNKKEVLINMENLRIDVRLRHNEPVDLIDMANSLISLSELASERISKEHGLKNTRVMLQGVKEGCDIYQLSFIFASHVLPIVESFNTVASFTGYLKNYIGLEDKTINEIENDASLTVNSANQVQTIVKPIENNSSSSLSIEVYGGNNNEINIFQINSEEADKIKKSADIVKQIKSSPAEEKESPAHEKVLIEMHQTIDSDKQVKHKAYCDDILKRKAVATTILNADDSKAILDNPYNNYFLVDVTVHKVNGSPKLYEITKLYNIVPKDE